MRGLPILDTRGIGKGLIARNTDTAIFTELGVYGILPFAFWAVDSFHEILILPYWEYNFFSSLCGYTLSASVAGKSLSTSYLTARGLSILSQRNALIAGNHHHTETNRSLFWPKITQGDESWGAYSPKLVVA